MSTLANRTWWRGAVLPFVVGLVAGYAVWLYAPQLTGRREPWDGDFGRYAGCLLAAGALAGLLVPRVAWACPLGTYLGQAIAMCSLDEIGSLAPLGLVIVLPVVSIVPLVGWCLGAAIHCLLALAFSRVFASTHSAGH